MHENIFAEVKQLVTARSAAEFYGIRTDRHGMARCPFHDDHTPSMKLDRNYYCFGCQAHGDAISFVSELFGIRPIEAARKMIRDMNLPVSEKQKQLPGTRDGPEPPDGRDQGGLKNTQTEIRAAEMENCGKGDTGKQLQELENYYSSILIRYRNRLQEQKSIYRPGTMESEWDPRFEEALSNISRTQYLLDLLLFGGPGDRIEMMKAVKEEVKRIEEQERRIHERAGEGCSDAAS